MNQDVVWQLIRYVLLLIGGYFVNKGVITSDSLTTILSGLGTVFVTAWGIYVKLGTAAVPIATAQRADVPTVSPATGVVKEGSGT